MFKFGQSRLFRLNLYIFGNIILNLVILNYTWLNELYQAKFDKSKLFQLNLAILDYIGPNLVILNYIWLNYIILG
jgi:hypothetical protein